MSHFLFCFDYHLKYIKKNDILYIQTWNSQAITLRIPLCRAEKRKQMKDIGRTLATYRKNNHLSQIDIANKLQPYGINVKNAAVSSWEKNNSTPTAAQLLSLCEILGISDIYTEFIGENPHDPFKDLNEEGVKKALEYIELLKKSGDYSKHVAEIIPIRSRIMRIALMPTSAGTGNFLGDENFEEREIYGDVPKCADFGVYLDGDSMEPRFHDEELIWIEKTECLENGDLGLFFLDGMTYFKKFSRNKIGTYLVSLNAKYKPIQVKEDSTFKIFGKLALD